VRPKRKLKLVVVGVGAVGKIIALIEEWQG
jgi:hypothetical protein